MGLKINKSFTFGVLIFFHVSFHGIVGYKNNSIQDGSLLDWITVVTVSKWYDDMFQNWLFWYEGLELNMKLVLIAEDQETYLTYSDDNSITVLKSVKQEV